MAEITGTQKEHRTFFTSRLTEIDDLRAEFQHLASKVENTQKRVNGETDLQIETLGQAIQELQAAMNSNDKKKTFVSTRSTVDDYDVGQLKIAINNNSRDLDEFEERLQAIEAIDFEAAINGLMARIEMSSQDIDRKQKNIEF